MSWERLSPPPLLEMVGALAGRGFLAALMLPSGVDEGVMWAVAAFEDMERPDGRGGSSEGDWLGRESEGVGEEGEGEAKGLSDSISSGVDMGEAMAADTGGRR